jgi:hypothetical protein
MRTLRFGRAGHDVGWSRDAPTSEIERPLAAGAFLAGRLPVGVGAGHGDADGRGRAGQQLLDGDDLEAGDLAPVGVPEPGCGGLGDRRFSVSVGSL